jgi:hypothetical protein
MKRMMASGSNEDHGDENDPSASNMQGDGDFLSEDDDELAAIAMAGCRFDSDEEDDEGADDLSRILLVDNSPVCFLMQPGNGVPISSFYDDGSDRALAKLQRLLKLLDRQPDVRPHLKALFNLTAEQIHRALG